MTFSSLITNQLLSPNYNARQGSPYYEGTITKITPHHTAFVGSAAAIANTFQSAARQASCNYAIGNDGEIWGVVPEEYRAWTSSSQWNDYKAITVEISNSEYGHPWYVSNKAINAFIALAVDICGRYGIKQLYWTGDTDGSLTVHRMFAPTVCCGDYLYNKMSSICNKINARLEGEDEEMTAEEKAYVKKLEARISAIEERAAVKYAWLSGKNDKVPDWALKDIKYLYDKGFITGTNTGSLALSYIELRVLCIVSRIAQKILK